MSVNTFLTIGNFCKSICHIDVEHLLWDVRGIAKILWMDNGVLWGRFFTILFGVIRIFCWLIKGDKAFFAENLKSPPSAVHWIFKTSLQKKCQLWLLIISWSNQSRNFFWAFKITLNYFTSQLTSRVISHRKKWWGLSFLMRISNPV